MKHTSCIDIGDAHQSKAKHFADIASLMIKYSTYVVHSHVPSPFFPTLHLQPSADWIST